MEGSSERLVVLRGINDAGVAITLINTPFQKRKHHFGGPKSPTRQVNSSGTNTGQIYRDSAVQIDGGRIADNLDGYYVTPTPRVEFPQRSPVISRMFHNIDAFAGSLRKYPMSGNLEKSQSAEIVQRILSYAQGRNFGKKTKSKSMRSLLRRCSTHHVCKRNKKWVGHADSPTDVWWADKGEFSDYIVDNRQGDLDLRYNYLNATMPKPGIEVRYLTGMKRAICDTLRDICDDTPKICPRMQRRYSHHKKHCKQEIAVAPSLQNKTSKACFCNTLRQCVCETNAKKKIESEKLIEDELLKIYPELVHTLESPFGEKKDLPTLVEEEVTGWVNNILPFYNINLMDDNEKNQLIDNLVRALHSIDRTDSIEAKNRIQNCLYSLPALRAYEHRDTLIKELSDNLVKKLRFLVDRNRVQDNVDKIVEQMLAKSNISDHNKDMIKKAVVHKLKPVLVNRALPEKDLEGFLTQEILHVIQKLPLDPKDIGDDFRQKRTSMQKNSESSPTIKEKEDMVLDWVKSLPELADITLTEKKKLIGPLVESLVKEDRPEKMKTIIKDWLNSVVNKGDRHLSSKSMNKLSKKLMAKLLPSGGDLVHISPRDSYGATSEEKNTTDTVMSWFQGIPELPFKNTTENKEAVKSLANKLKDIQQRNTNADDAQAESRKEVSNWLKNMLKNNNIYLHPTTVDNLVNGLVNDLQEVKDPIKSSESRQRQSKLYEDILTWLTKLPYVDLKNVDKYKNYVDTLVSNLHNIQSTKYDDQSLKNKITDEVHNWLNILSDETGLGIYETDKQNLLKIIINQVVTSSRARKKWHKIKTLKKGIQDAVSSALDSYPSTLFNKHNIISGISDLLHKNLKSEKTDPKKTRAQIIKYLEKYTKLPSSDINNIANNIIHKMKRISKTRLFKKRSAVSPKPFFVQPNVDSEQDYSRSSSVSEEILEENHADENYDSLSERSTDRTLTYEQRGARKSFVTSTPKKEFRASLDSILSIPPIRYESYKDKDDADEKISQRQNIKNVIKDWIQELDINDDLKNKIIDDLTEEITDRQRYLKLSNTKTSSNLELEHLKFQIFKRLNKAISDKDLSKCMTKIKNLKAQLDTLESSKDKNYETTESLSYKEQLELIITRTVPATGNDDSFEALKHNLADAFVSLHYCSGDEEAKNKYKKIIYEEINKYCYEYLQRYPVSSLDPKKLNRDLYSALIKVPAPDKELLEPTYNISKIENEIRNWLTEISTDKSSLKTESTRNSISILANNLYHIQEKHKYQPGSNVKEEMLKTILDWFRHFPMTSEHKVDIKSGAKILFTNIINSKAHKSSIQPQERTVLSPIKTNENDSLKISVTAKSAPVTSTTLNKTSNGTQYAVYLPPPSLLSAEDRAHLDMIRARSPSSVRRETQIHIRKDASNDTQPINISTQTDVAINTGNDKQTHDSAVTQTVQTPNATVTENPNFNVDVSPQVIVKEYLWNSNDSRQGSTIYSPRNPTTNITAPQIPSINTGAPVNVVTHNEYPQQPLIPPVERQPNVLSQATNVSTQHNSGQEQEQSHSFNITKRTHTYNPEPEKRERPTIIHEKISQTHIERRPQQRGYFNNAPNYENLSRNRPLLSGYPTPNEQALLERTRQLGERYIFKQRGFTEPYLEQQETSRRIYRRQDKYESRQLGQRCCKCGGRVITKCRSPRYNHRRDDEHKMCSKCFGSYCPHPSPLYFNSDF